MSNISLEQLNEKIKKLEERINYISKIQKHFYGNLYIERALSNYFQEIKKEIKK